jgi:hypothetical protein
MVNLCIPTDGDQSRVHTFDISTAMFFFCHTHHQPLEYNVFFLWWLLLGLRDPVDDGATVIQNISNSFPINMV